MTWAPSECACIIHKPIVQERCFDLDSVRKVTSAFSLTLENLNSELLKIGKKSLENSANRQKIKPHNRLTDTNYIHL